MNRNTARWLLGLAGVLLVVGLPFIGKWSRRDLGPRCELSGLRIEPLYQVRVVDRAGSSHRFCCNRCATRWLTSSGIEPEAVYMTDEAGGGEIDAREAYFVDSRVVTNRVTENRTHTFRVKTDAEAHARTFSGSLLEGADRPALGNRGER